LLLFSTILLNVSLSPDEGIESRVSPLVGWLPVRAETVVPCWGAGWSRVRVRWWWFTIEPPAQAKVRLNTVTLRSLWVSVTDLDALIAARAAK